MKKASLVILIVISSFIANAQADTAYIYTYGGIQNDVCNQIRPTYDKGYIAIGTTNSDCSGNTNMYVIKTDSSLKKQWSEAIGGPMNQGGYSVAPTLDHGYAFLGFTDSYGAGGYDVFLVKTDSAGKVKWQKTYGGSDWDFGYSIRQTLDSGFVICGLTYSYGAGNGDVYVVRTDKNGDTLWTSAIGGKGCDIGYSLAVLKDSLYAIIGATTSYGKGDTDAYFVMIDNKGIVKKTVTYGSTHNDLGNSINVTLDNGFVIYGSTDSIQPGKYDEMMVKTDSIGDMQWMQIYHSPKTGIGKDALQKPDGTYVSVGTNNSYGLGGYKMHMQHLASAGWYIAGPSFGGTGDEEGNSVALASNGNIVFAGSTDSPGYTVGLDDFYLVRPKYDSVIQNYTLAIHQHYDTCLCPLGIPSQSFNKFSISVFPNPMLTSANILVQGVIAQNYKFSIYDVFGRCVIQGIPIGVSTHGQSVGYISRGDLSAGMYFYELNGKDGRIATGKLVVE